jgi:TATA-binding protein-associated factor
VNVYRLITEGTVEEKVMRLQRFKADTANALVGADNRSLASMATDELLELFSLDSAGGGTSTGSASKAGEKKRRRLDNGQSGTESGGEWKMDKLWGTAQGEEGGGELLPDDELLEQYSEQHSLQAFLQQSTY